MFQLASQRQRQPSILGLAAEHRPFRRPAYREKALAVRRFDKLRNDHAGRPERRVDVPDRTRTAILGQIERCRVEPLGDVARLVDPQEEERHPVQTLAMQRGEPMSDLLERNRKSRGQLVQVILRFFRHPVERGVRHQVCGSEVVGQFNMAPGQTPTPRGWFPW